MVFPLIAIVGPTGVGKTNAALHLASLLDIEVVSADSRQVYRHMDIGTAKPSTEARIRVPHHLIDVADPEDDFSLATFLGLARHVIADIVSRKHLPVVVGGTGQYIWGLLEHWQVPMVPADPQLRQWLSKQEPERLFARLSVIDPRAAERIHPRNVRRIIRALEVYYLTGLPFSMQKGRGVPPFKPWVIGLTMPRQALHHHIDGRMEAMLSNGWLEEVRWLLAHGYNASLPAMSSTGYWELMNYLNGGVVWPEAVRRIKTGLHRLVRHQYSWFHLDDTAIQWLDVSQDSMPQLEAAVRGFCGRMR